MPLRSERRQSVPVICERGPPIGGRGAPEVVVSFPTEHGSLSSQRAQRTPDVQLERSSLVCSVIAYAFLDTSVIMMIFRSRKKD
jgi:hypothetical protein